MFAKFFVLFLEHNNTFLFRSLSFFFLCKTYEGDFLEGRNSRTGAGSLVRSRNPSIEQTRAGIRIFSSADHCVHER